MSIRDEIARLAGSGDVPCRPLAVDVLARSGIRADHRVPGPLEPEELARTFVEPPSDTFEGGPSEGADPGDRYERKQALGEGGMGIVELAHDRNLGRDVALKSIPPGRLDDSRLARFVAEARITAQLEHPGIVPVHDLFINAEGDVFYSMKRVQGQSLREVISALRDGKRDALMRFNLVHLLRIFESTCQAVAYAHTRRVIHRDLKPANIMVGDFGEVLVMDWGVARVLDDAPEELREIVQDGTSLSATADGAMVGSPAYMAPEQLKVGPNAVGPEADVWALGVILYELLTYQRPFRADSVARLLYLAAKGECPRPSEVAVGRDIPAEVESICLRALDVDPRARYADAGLLLTELEAFLEGVGPRQEANRLVARGRSMLLVYSERARDVEDEETRTGELLSQLKPWDPIELKKLAWEAERELADAVAEADRVFGDCEAAFESALSHVPAYTPAREGLADLYWIRFLQAEAGGDARWERRWRELILRYAPDRYARQLDGSGTLTLRTVPEAAEAALHPLEERDGRMIPLSARDLGCTPVERRPVAMGSYVLRLRAEGRAETRLPLVVRRMQNVGVHVRLPRRESIRPGFVYVPAGPVYLGGDPAAISGRPETYPELPDFAIAAHPVSVADYIRFLLALRERDPELAFRHLPRARSARGVRNDPMFDLDAGRGNLELPFQDRDGTLWKPDQPVVSVTIADARAYAAWLSESSPGPALRLPDESEWEKAARGADRRIFPWGDRFDASFCVMAESSPEPPERCRIGQEPRDVSPYGVHDLAGGVRDWVEWDSEAEQADAPGRNVLRGGSYGTVEVYCRTASRSVVSEHYVGSHVGFRLAHDLPR